MSALSALHTRAVCIEKNNWQNSRLGLVCSLARVPPCVLYTISHRYANTLEVQEQRQEHIHLWRYPYYIVDIITHYSVEHLRIPNGRYQNGHLCSTLLHTRMPFGNLLINYGPVIVAVCVYFFPPCFKFEWKPFNYNSLWMDYSHL